MLGSRMEDALNGQLNGELQAAYTYLAMAAHSDAQSLPGFAHWLEEQAREELGHAMRFYRFILDRGGKISLKAIQPPPSDFGTLLEVFERALQNEQSVTRSIYELYKLAEEEEDYASHTLLEDFAAEQVEEEKSVTEIIDSVRRVGADGTGLLLLDRELAQRSRE